MKQHLAFSARRSMKVFNSELIYTYNPNGNLCYKSIVFLLNVISKTRHFELLYMVVALSIVLDGTERNM